MEDLTDLIADWPVGTAAVGVTSPDGTLATGGDPAWRNRIASVAKLFVGFAALVALEEESVSLEEPAGPEGATVNHLLAHTSGLNFDSHDVVAAPGRRRINSNTGIEVFVDHLTERTGMDFSEYLEAGVLDPLGLEQTSLEGSPAHDVTSSVDDLLAFARELLAPTLVSPATLAEATRVHFPEVSGVLPGIGSFDPNPWGLTFEIKADKAPHWTASANSPQTFGHFAGSGSFLWVDPAAGLGVVALADRDFDAWALEAWPRFSDAVLERFG